MSTRERWIVYPLLFLALGLVLRTSLEKSVNAIEFRCQTIECHNLRVRLINGQPALSQPVTFVVPTPIPPDGARDEENAADAVADPEAPPAETQPSSPGEP